MRLARRTADFFFSSRAFYWLSAVNPRALILYVSFLCRLFALGADLINLQRTHGTRQTLQAKAILKLLQMRDSLRAVRDRVVTAPAAASATAQIGSLPLCQSFFDPTLLHRAPSAAALLASYSKQVRQRLVGRLE